MGRSYLSESRLQHACDAGVLAARKKLGASVVADGLVPAGVASTGNKFFNLDFRNGVYGTQNRGFTMTLEPDFSISGEATAEVPTTIMKIFGFNKVSLRVECQAKLNFNNTDVMMVLDTTLSMDGKANSSDPATKMETLKTVVRNFHTTMEGSKGPGTRIRYGFVPYSTNVNVGALLQDSWVVNDWTYQSREVDHTTSTTGSSTYDDNWAYVSGTYTPTDVSSYAATWHPPASEFGSGWYSCDGSEPADTYTDTFVVVSTASTPYAGPPAGFRTIEHRRRTLNGANYWTSQSGSTCAVKQENFGNYVDDYDRITIPTEDVTTYYNYKPISRSVTNWRSETNGCIEERSTYQITDYANVDLNQALDLNLDLVPSAGDPDTQWRPRYPGITYERSLDYYGSGSFSSAPVLNTANGWMFQPGTYSGLVACPAPSRKLAEMDATTLNSFLSTVTPLGTTYHDIGMIWGGRLISPTGLFAAENGDLPGKPTNRHLIFLTDGQTEAFDTAYGAYGIEPLDQRRLPSNKMNQLNSTVEARFGVACAEVKKRNTTVWVIGFGTNVTNVMKNCAGNGRWFLATDAAELNTIFGKIAASMGDLRISK